MAPRGRYRTPGRTDRNRDEASNGAGEGTRTPDPLITNQMLYQLSYAGLAIVVAKQSRTTKY